MCWFFFLFVVAIYLIFTNSLHSDKIHLFPCFRWYFTCKIKHTEQHIGEYILFVLLSHLIKSADKTSDNQSINKTSDITKCSFSVKGY